MSDNYEEYTVKLQTVIKEIDSNSLTVKNTVGDQLIYLCEYGTDKFRQNTGGFYSLTKEYTEALVELINALYDDMNMSDKLNDYDEVDIALEFLLPYTKWCIKLSRALDHCKNLLNRRTESEAWMEAWTSAENSVCSLVQILRDAI